MNKKVVLFLLIILFIILWSYWYDLSTLNKNSVVCRRDSDCAIYQCSSCGNKVWLQANYPQFNQEECKAIPFESCVCKNNACKRKY
ncbi:hypothetical protein D6821_01610 [Candidatus Parcubacteria bacterium]|nr:MAG: hypothetical protein D6821_01610 [Candidatus Parcubacteria bacterium]